MPAIIDGRTLRRHWAQRGERPRPLRATLDGDPWTEGRFGASRGKARTKAGIADLTFHDIRGSAVRRLAITGWAEADIASPTRHSTKEISAILDAHDMRLAESAIHKRETGMTVENGR